MKKKVVITIIVGIILFFVISGIILFSILGLFIIGVASSGDSASSNVIVTNSNITGVLTVSSREEKEYAKMVVDTLFNALEDKDSQAIKGLFSEYAKNNTYDLDGKINKLLRFYPGADGGYESSSISSEDNDYGTKSQALELVLTIKNQGSKYEIKIGMYIRNDFDSSKVGVHFIEVLVEENAPSSFKWKSIDDAPGIYFTI